VDKQVRAKWGRGLDELPTVKLVAISAHNESIQDEFAWAFSLHNALEEGSKVFIEWRSVGGGGSTIGEYLRNIYSRSESSDIDILWGGGDFVHMNLADRGWLEPLDPSALADVLANVPPQLGGVPLYDPNLRWFGSALSGFGFLYNSRMLHRVGVQPPEKWEDLGEACLANLIVLTDPTQSSSAAVAYEMIVQSAPTWPQGWAKLLSILGNAKLFTDSAGTAANAPAFGEALVATSIDFYALTRVAEAPEDLAYVSPQGQTAFTPDPIAILKNPPNRRLATHFVEFVLSARGQALWALRVGEPDGPVRRPLARQPIRRDVYDLYAGKMLPRIVNPYQAGQTMRIDTRIRGIRSSVLKELVRSAAIDNRDSLRAAKRRLIETGFDRKLLEEFGRLPANVDTEEKIAQIAGQLKDEAAAERITTEWTRFFREKYAAVAR